MLKNVSVLAVLAGLALMSRVTVAQAQVGEPTGSFHLTVQHGGTTVVDTDVIVPADLKINDGDPEGFVQVGSVGNSPIILKMVSDDDPNFRIVHWYLDVPTDLNNIYFSNGDSLFNPLNPATIDVSITGLQFTGTTDVTPLLVNNDTYLTAFMRDVYLGDGGRFYNLPGSNLYGPGVLSAQAQAQVAGNKFFDGSPLYTFAGNFGGPSATWTWGGLPNPATFFSNAIMPDGTQVPGDGRVFELGLSVAFVGVPEPATLAFVLPGALALLRRRRTR